MSSQNPFVFAAKLYRSIRRGEVIRAAYLSYHYSKLFLYGIVYRKNFVSSHSPVEMTVLGHEAPSGTGNFPASPSLCRMLFGQIQFDSQTSLVDVGCGSGLVLFVAYTLGMRMLTGLEYGKEPADLARSNLHGIANIIHADAFCYDYSESDIITFFSPFRGELAKRFFDQILKPSHKLITVNHDPVIEPVLSKLGFIRVFSFQHPIYKNFNGHVWLNPDCNQL